MRFFSHNKFIYYFLRYFIIIVLAIVVNMIGYFAAINVLEEQISKNDMNALENTRALCDEYLSRMQRISFSVLNSKTVSMLAKPGLSNEKQFEYKQLLLDEISNYHLESESFAIIFRNKDLCIHSDMGVLDTSLLYTIEYKNYYDYKSVWEDSLFSSPGINCRILVPTTGDESKVVMVQYVPGISRDIVLIVGIDNRMFKNMVPASNDGELYVCTDLEDNVLFSSINKKDLDGEIKRGDYLNLEVESKYGFKYIKFTKKSLYLSGVRKVRAMVILGILLSLLFVGFIAYLIAKNNYKTELKLREENENHIVSQKNEALRRLISNKEFDEDRAYISSFKQQIGMPLTLVLVEMFVENKNKEFLQYISNYLKDYLKVEPIVKTQNTDIICIINSQSVDTVGLFKKLCEKIKNDFDIKIICSISDESNDFSNINQLYIQAQEASMEYSLNSYESVFVYKKIENDEYDEKFGLKKEAKLIELLESGYEKDACKLIESFIGRNTEDKVVFSKILGIIFDVCDRVNIDDNDEIQHICDSLYAYYNHDEYYKYKKRIYEYVSVLCRYIDKNKVNNDRNMSIYAKEKCHEIKKHIDDNFSDANLNVNSVAQTYGLSRSWVSANFKKQYGVTISTYIVQCRINKAKELLATEMSVGNIAEACGFADKTVYYRTFKKCEKMTSNEYRALLKLKDSVEE